MESLTCTVVLRQMDEDQEIASYGDLIGVDAGALFLAMRGYEMRLAIGDFDSISERDIPLIKMNTKEFIKLNTDKNISDFEAALQHLSEYEKIIVYGGLEGRQDHQYALLERLKMDKRLRLVNETNLVYVLDEGIHRIKKESYKYLSLFALEPSLISIEGTKYPLHLKVLEQDVPSYTLSNEILKEEAILSIRSGKLIIIQSSDKKSYARIAD